MVASRDGVVWVDSFPAATFRPRATPFCLEQVLFFGYDTLDKLLANTGSYSLPLLCFLCVGKVTLALFPSGCYFAHYL